MTFVLSQHIVEIMRLQPAASNKQNISTDAFVKRLILFMTWPILRHDLAVYTQQPSKQVIARHIFYIYINVPVSGGALSMDLASTSTNT